ncbi:uncharacterized protein LOC131429168 [Malaya genurostris]|uniref:uncharacterized protein LOC131429168 n=1 Tax=Malaya genurostris TaxID=325434 RepID=UPI0026F3885C|nr:uncharacterized protein LOC131429168 [Malaya genurostris]
MSPRENKSTRNRQYEAINAAFDVVAVATNQGSMINSESSSQRLLVIVCLFGLMFLGVGYSAKIVSLIQAPSEKISSLKDLLDSRLEIGINDALYNRKFLAAATDPVRRALYDQKIVGKNGSLNIYELNEGVARIREGLFAYHGDLSPIYYTVSETFTDVEKCYLREIRSEFIGRNGYHIVKRNYTMREQFIVGFMRMREVGVSVRHYSRMNSDKPGCEKGTEFRPLSVIDLIFAIQIVIGGITLAVIVMFAERAWISYQRWKVPMFEFTICVSTPDSATLISDLILFLKVPLKLAVFVCWNEEKSFQFIRKLLKSDGSRSFLLQLKSPSVENLPILDTLEPHQHLAIVDAACPETGNFLAAAGYRIYDKIRWVILNGNQTYGPDPDPVDAQENIVLRTLADLPVTGRLYRRSMRTDLITSVIGIWRNGTIRDLRKENTVVVRRRNLEKVSVNITSVYYKNYTLNHFNDNENKHIDTMPRLSYQVLHTLLVYYLNATPANKVTNNTGYLDPKTGKMTGMILDLMNHDAEVGGSIALMVRSRLPQVDFMKINFPADMKYVFKTPNLSITNNIFELPFASSVWLCLLGLLIVAAGAFATINIISPRENKSTRNRQHEAIDAAFDVVAVATNQGSMINSESLSQRLLVIVCLFGLMFLGVGYSAKIVSLIQAPSEKISSLKDLLDSRLELGINYAFYNRIYLAAAKDPVRRALYEQKIVGKNGSLNIYELNDGVSRLREGLFAYHGDLSPIYYRISETFNDVEKCYLREIRSEICNGYYIVQLNYTMREHFNVGFARMWEVGVSARKYSMMNSEKPRCVEGTEFRPLKVIDLIFAMEIVTGGVAMAVIIMIVEYNLPLRTLSPGNYDETFETISPLPEFAQNGRWLLPGGEYDVTVNGSPVPPSSTLGSL